MKSIMCIVCIGLMQLLNSFGQHTGTDLANTAATEEKRAEKAGELFRQARISVRGLTAEYRDTLYSATAPYKAARKSTIMMMTGYSGVFDDTEDELRRSGDTILISCEEREADGHFTIKTQAECIVDTSARLIRSITVWRNSNGFMGNAKNREFNGSTKVLVLKDLPYTIKDGNYVVTISGPGTKKHIQTYSDQWSRYDLSANRRLNYRSYTFSRFVPFGKHAQIKIVLSP